MRVNGYPRIYNMKNYSYNTAVKKRFYKQCSYKVDGIKIVMPVHTNITWDCGTDYCVKCKNIDDTFKHRRLNTDSFNKYKRPIFNS